MVCIWKYSIIMNIHGIIESQLFRSLSYDASGGVITYDGDYKIHTFNSSASFIVLNDTLDASILILGQGGNGGAGYTGTYRSAGGGGAAGIIKQFNQNLPHGTHSVSFGAFPGGSVSFAGQTATGGENGANGISGLCGNGGSNATYAGGSGCRTAGLPPTCIYAGGGAGSGGNGGRPSGGIGVYSSISGTSIQYGVGGNGGISIGDINGHPGPAGIVIIRYKYK